MACRSTSPASAAALAGSGMDYLAELHGNKLIATSLRRAMIGRATVQAGWRPPVSVALWSLFPSPEVSGLTRVAWRKLLALFKERNILGVWSDLKPGGAFRPALWPRHDVIRAGSFAVDDVDLHPYFAPFPSAYGRTGRRLASPPFPALLCAPFCGARKATIPARGNFATGIVGGVALKAWSCDWYCDLAQLTKPVDYHL